MIVEGLQVLPGLGMNDRGAFGRQRDEVAIVDPEEPAAAQVDDRMEIGDRPGIGIVAGLVAQPAMAVGDALALFLGDAEMTGRPGLDQHLAEVGDAAPGAGLLEARIGLGDLAAHGKFVGDDPGLGPFDMLP